MLSGKLPGSAASTGVIARGTGIDAIPAPASISRSRCETAIWWNWSRLPMYRSFSWLLYASLYTSSSVRKANHSLSAVVTITFPRLGFTAAHIRRSAERSLFSNASRSRPISSWASSSLRLTSIPSVLATLSNCESSPARLSMLEGGPSVNSAMPLCLVLGALPRVLDSVPFRHWQERHLHLGRRQSLVRRLLGFGALLVKRRRVRFRRQPRRPFHNQLRGQSWRHFGQSARGPAVRRFAALHHRKCVGDLRFRVPYLLVVQSQIHPALLASHCGPAALLLRPPARFAAPPRRVLPPRARPA